MVKILILACIVCLTACGKQQNATHPNTLIGKWSGSEVTDSRTDLNSKDAQAQIDMARHSTLTLRDNDSFSLSLMVEMEGKWKCDGSRIVLHPTKVGGSEVGRPDTRGQTVHARDLIGSWSDELIVFPAQEQPWVGVTYTRR